MKKYLYLLICLVCAGCVDKNIDLAEIEGNIGIHADHLVIPLGTLNDMSLGDILGTELENVNVDSQTGDYSVSFGVEEQSLVIDGADNRFAIPSSKFDVNVEYPSFKLSDTKCTLDTKCFIGGQIGGIELVKGLDIVNPFGGIEIAGVQDGETGYMLDVHVPEYIKRIDRVYVEHDPNLPGAPLEAVFDFGCISDINGGGTLNVELVLPGDYEVYDDHFNLLKDNRYQIKDLQIAPGTKRVAFTLYIGSIINHHEAEDGELHMPGGLEYHISYNLKTKPGRILVDEIPTLSLKTELVCEDAEILLGAMDLMPYQEFKNTISVDSFNEGIKSVKSIDLEGTVIELFVKGMDWWGDDAVASGALNDIFVELTMPQSFKFTLLDNSVGFNSATNTIHATLAQLRNGIKLNLQQIYFGENGIAPGADGKINVDMNLGLRVALADGALIRLKYLQHEGDVAISAGYEAADLVVTAVTGRVDFKHEESVSVDIANLVGDIGLEINGLGVSPVIDFSLSNSLTLPLYVNASIAPVRGGQVAESEVVSIDSFEIKAAKVGENSQVTPTSTVVRLGKNLEQEAGVTNVECDLESLFNGALPESLNITLSVATNPNEDMSFVVLPSYAISYGYSFFMPLSFGESLDLTYSGHSTEIGNTVGNLDLGISATGAIALICEVENTTPFNLELDFQMLDSNGNKTPLQILSDNSSIIKGSADGKTPTKSTIKLQLRSDNSNILDGLKDVADLSYTLHATSAANGVALNSNQTVSAVIQLEVDGDLNINLNE